jgi:3'(2'), 5'-bisphosphate nucleotidase
VSEEAVPKQAPGRDFVLIDPLDGTKELIAGRDEFTVNIAIVRSGDPVLGVVTAPALDMIWRGIVGHGADRISGDGVPVPIHTRPRPQRLTVAVSRTHPDAATEALLARLPVGHRIACGSALKFCRVAEGEADFYPRLAPTSEWDLAAGHAVLVAAGGVVVTPDGAPLRYGHVGNEFLVPGFMAWGSLT